MMWLFIAVRNLFCQKSGHFLPMSPLRHKCLKVRALWVLSLPSQAMGPSRSRGHGRPRLYTLMPQSFFTCFLFPKIFIAVIACQKSGHFWFCVIGFLKKVLRWYIPSHTFAGKQQRYEHTLFNLHKITACNDACLVGVRACGTG